MTKRSLRFPLDVEDGWPPVAVECLPFTVVAGGLELQAAPLFVKKLSVGDVIRVVARKDEVRSWKHRRRSKHSTIWLLETARGAKRQVAAVGKRLRALGCVTTTAEQLGVHAVDVPPEASLADVDAVLATLDGEKVAVAFPSLRHPDA